MIANIICPIFACNKFVKMFFFPIMSSLNAVLKVWDGGEKYIYLKCTTAHKKTSKCTL